MIRQPSQQNKNAWIELYEARSIPQQVDTRPPGRPPSPIPRKKVGITLSQGEIHEIEVWQRRFSVLLQRSISVGETIGILTRLCTTRFSNLEVLMEEEDLFELVEKMVGND